jgi:gluconolactonase
MATLLATDARPERLTGGCQWAEGPVWTRAGRLRWSDIPADRVLEYDPATGGTEVVDAAAEYANGRTLDLAGAIVQCSHGRRRVERVHADGSITSIVDRVVDGTGAHRLNSPNDVVVDSTGAIWFTDPPYGIQPDEREGHAGVEEYGGCHVFRFDEATGVLTAVVTGMVHPNGLALSPDEGTLYVADTGVRRDGESYGLIEAYRIVRAADGIRCVDRRVLIDMPGAVSDGFRVDDRGRIWTSAGAGLRVFSPEGAELLRMELPETVSNLCFGGPDGHDLYLTATTSLYRLRVTARDARGARA